MALRTVNPYDGGVVEIFGDAQPRTGVVLRRHGNFTGPGPVTAARACTLSGPSRIRLTVRLLRVSTGRLQVAPVRLVTIVGVATVPHPLYDLAANPSGPPAINWMGPGYLGNFSAVRSPAALSFAVTSVCTRIGEV